MYFGKKGIVLHQQMEIPEVNLIRMKGPGPDRAAYTAKYPQQPIAKQ
jgi:hypothetical protein